MPLAIDLYCGLGGWAEGFLAEGYRVVGFDIECRPYPADLVLQDVTTLHGSQFRDATVIVASPPCQAYSYRAMPWKRAKALGPPDNTLFETCFRIQREASEAAGYHIPMVVENVRGAQKWLGPIHDEYHWGFGKVDEIAPGRARWHYGSYYLWGDVPALMPIAAKKGTKVSGLNWSGSDKPGYKAEAFNGTAEQRMNEHLRFKSNPGTHDRTEGPGRPRFIREHVKGDALRGSARKHASAMIAKIPFPLAQHVARTFRNNLGG